ncbi:DUF5004 domain-containing protein [Mucilaginibacter gotjawali]|uniref:Uncharacterized protein n=2 Tax=Mucilaginibacter gotjawali TaxID=1550579 RepID=A0A125T2E6_9SPHI|nr:DUF5004 domain-containing protein [Mucilaginibacter gotjawali]MBB3057301.1 hypothetical protein [Mucilaginibacter gotjawali]BAU52932.1 hypothetical protein MgSA37_01096 [Mucilaginibacter gotjawali]
MNNHFILKKQAYLFIAAMALLWTSCKMERIAPVTESKKDLTGTWKVVQATRNGTNLLPIYDFTQFSIKFDATTGNYNLLNPVPFIVGADGKFSLDDPQYPYKLTFTATGGAAVATAFNYPIINGTRQIIMTFSPGCSQNTYVFTLSKTN